MSDTMHDSVCGMPVHAGAGLSLVHLGNELWFCSEVCREQFRANPARYLKSAGDDVGLQAISRRVAYFSMEVCIDVRIPTYSGGLGVLAGDTLHAAADLRVPMVGVTLLYRKGYFTQRLDEWGHQRELPASWEPTALLTPLAVTTEVEIEGRPVKLRAWLYRVTGGSEQAVPLLFLDTDLDGNAPQDRALCQTLYGGDARYRLAQEAVLGIGGVRMLRALGFDRIERFHMNEGHASLLVLELLREARTADAWPFDLVRERCVFTTHTPVTAGHDRFPYPLYQSVLGELLPFEVVRMLGGPDELNMTLLGLNMSHYINGVAKKHREVSQAMFPDYPIAAITNAVHSATWVSTSFRALYDRHIPGWASDPNTLRHAVRIPSREITEAHELAKEKLLGEVARRTGIALPVGVLTIGFARRATAYKRADLVFSDLAQLSEVARTAGPLQFLFAGKAHPSDGGGKALIERVAAMARQLHDQIRILYLEDYDMELARLLIAGVDLWLNTPCRPLEASGTSGMKAAHNGVPSFSVLDGWWLEGHIEGVTGWSIGGVAIEKDTETDPSPREAQELYYKLRTHIAPMFYHDTERWVEVMRHAIALNASHFHTHRMLQQYITQAYLWPSHQNEVLKK